MFLKEIELKGFKSFAERVSLSFSGGITCIVGPNGAGKSNLMEAIRFGLGETAFKPMRSSSLEDVIFSGSASKAPMSFAYVNLLFDNERGLLPVRSSEVKITRKVYRDGESQFLINGQPVKLRDIHHLFLGTGLGKDTYAFVLQGQIERVLSTKPEERRLLVEEAAGISRLFVKKKQALNDLEKTRTQLVRISDLLATLSAQLPVLEKQAKKAEKVKIWRQELIEMEKIWFGYQRERLSEKLREEKDKQLQSELLIRNLESRLEELSQKRSKRKEERMALLRELEDCEGKAEKVRKRIVHMEGEKQYSLKWMAQQDQRCDEQADEYARLEVERIERGKKLFKIQETLRTQEAEKEKQQRKMQRADQRVSVLREAYARVERELNAEQAEAFERERAEIEAKNQRLFHEKLKKEWQEQIDRLQQELAGIASHRRKQLQRLKEKEAKREEIRKQKWKLKEQHQKLTRWLRQAEEDLAALKRRCEAIREEVLKEEARLEAKASGKRYLAAEQLLSQSPWRDRVLGTVSSLLGEGKHPALVSFLERYGQAMAISGWEAARACTKILESAGVPFCLYVIEGPEDLPPGARLLSEFHSQKSFSDSEANAFPLQLSYTGVVSYGKCIWSAVGASRQENVLKVLKGLEASSWEGYSKLWEQMRKRRSEQEETFSRISELETEEVLLSNELKGRRKTIADFIEREKQLALRLQKMQAKKEELKSLAEDKKVCTESREKVLEVLQAKWQKAQRIYQEALVRQKTLEMREKEIDQRMEMLCTQARDLYDQKSLLSAKEKILEKIRAWRIEREQLKVQIAQAEKEKAELDGALQELNRAREAMKFRLRGLDEQAEVWQKEEGRLLAELEEEKGKLWKSKQNEEEIYRKLSDLERYLLEQYDLEPSTIPPVSTLGQPESEFEQSLLRARNRIRMAGGVDEESLRLYEAQKKEVEHLKAQKEDLERAIEEIKKGIHSIEIQAAKEFARTFQKISKTFQALFVELFGGGEAKLYLSGDGPLLQRGVEIMVSLPGKKRQNLNLLSGGEKSLIAIAFMLSILKAKPSPFVVLDEVDAALDEANVQRFKKIIRLFEGTQFILITHNRKTMEMADHLLGVTQEEPGVSKVVSLDLSEVPAHASEMTGGRNPGP